MKNVVVSDMTLKIATEEIKKDLSFREKLSIAKNLEKTGVTIIELPACHNKKEDKIVNKTISDSVSIAVAIDCGIEKEEIEFAYESIKTAKEKILQVVLPVSTVQMEYMYHLKAPKMLDKIASVIKTAREYSDKVELVAKDATRAEEGFIVQVAKTAYDQGASVITLCDDNGEGFSNAFNKDIKDIKSACDIKVYVCPSDKIKMSPAIAVEALIAGADGVKTSTVGEYLPLDVLADIVRARGADLKVDTTLNHTLIKKTISEMAEVGEEENAKAEYNNSVKLSSSLSIKEIGEKTVSLGYDLSVEDVGKVYEEFVRVCSKKGAIGERELEAIVASTAMQVPSTFHLNSYVVNSGNIISATANIALEKDGEIMSGVSTGDGPIDAAFHAIEQIIGHHYELDDLNVSAVTKGREAVGSAIVRLRANGKLYSGNGVSTDIVGACIRAYVNALNKIVYEEK